MSGRTCSTHIDAPVRSVFEVMRDPASFTELMPGVQFVPEVVTADGVGTTSRFHTRVAGLPIRGGGRFTQVEADRHIRDGTSIPIKGSFDYWFEDEDGGTRVTILPNRRRPRDGGVGTQPRAQHEHCPGRGRRVHRGRRARKQ